MPRQVMQLARKSVQVQPVRGKAVSNWKRPTMDEYLAPHEAYGPANAKRQKSYNMFFLGKKPHNNNNCLLIPRLFWHTFIPSVEWIERISLTHSFNHLKKVLAILADRKLSYVYGVISHRLNGGRDSWVSNLMKQYVPYLALLKK